ncbi:MAG: hypothetical protein NTX17_09530 [Candidatus Eisenbacteria bacterium]|nr:hypothetical protein [Candidatus Eisenbacteria bacterium]
MKETQSRPNLVLLGTAFLVVFLAAFAATAPFQAPPAFAGPPQKTGEGIEFQFYAPDAKAVYLSGEFNDWAPEADLMTKDEDGIFRLTKRLSPRRYEYKFVIDGTWKEDPANPAKAPDPYGGSNSVIVVLENGEVSMEVAKKPSPAPIVGQITASGRPIYFAILWHQHQPRYERDSVSGEYLDPWVRLHCAKDYYDMAAMVQEFEGLKYSVNLTPVLLTQMEEIVRGYETNGPTDKMLRLSARPASALTQDDKVFLLARFFDANWSNQIDPFPRYRELRDRRVGFSPEKLLESVPRYSAQDFLDLQVWFNLAWMDPDFLKGGVELPSGLKIDLSDLVKKGQGFTEAEKKRLLDAQIEIMRNVIPIHKKLQDAGRIEVTTTPFYHPILPLIYDTDLAQVAMPNVVLPSERFSFPGDATEQVRRASAFYEQRFGRKPEGMWPGEGAVAQEIIDVVASQGFKWFATDMENLAQSLGKTNLTDEEKFSIYRGTQNGASLGLVFRDTGFSNDIGFKFARVDPVEAANDFIKNLSNIQRDLADSDKDHIVVVILDGENPWQNYENDGKDFLRALYSQLAKASWVKTTTISEFLRTHPLETLPVVDKLWAGSWDGHSFATWIGEPDEDAAWDDLTLARRAFEEWKAGAAAGEGEEVGDRGKAAGAAVKAPDARLVAQVYELLLAAEGSDWFWWYGKDKDSGNDERFDEAFRNTLKQAYVLMGKEPPEYLSESIIGVGARAATVSAAGKGPLPGGTEKTLLSMDDPLGDDNGPGSYTYPTNAVFVGGAYDAKHFEVSMDSTDIFFRVSIAGDLTDPWGGDVAFCLQGIDLYIDTDGKPGSGAKQLYTARNANAGSGSEWEYYVMANMDEVGLYDVDLKRIPRARVAAWGDPLTRTITVKVPVEFVGKPDRNWKVIAFVVGHDGYSPGRVRPITTTSQEWSFGGSVNSSLEPGIIDLIVPPGQSQKDILGAFKATGKLVEIPGVKIMGK